MSFVWHYALLFTLNVYVCFMICKLIWKRLVDFFTIKSPCCGCFMVNDKCHDAFGDMPVYKCVGCDKEWI